MIWITVCQHCQEARKLMRRNLCKRCYMDRKIRYRYRSIPGPRRPETAPGVVLPSSYRMPGTPTQAVPGSEEKIMILQERASRRESLFHPQDLRIHRRGLNLDLPPGLLLTSSAPADDDAMDDSGEAA